MRAVTTDFPRVYESIPTSRLLAVYAAAPARQRRALEGLTERDLRARPRPGKWSVLEIAVHMADAELVGAGRLRFAIAQPGTDLIGYDQDLWADRLAYQSLDEIGLEAVLRLFELLRRTGTMLLERLTDDDWSNWAMHPHYGPVTVRHLLEIYADHGERHIAQILTLRAMLGVPVEMTPLLEERLF
jgi:hypothetical protein